MSLSNLTTSGWVFLLFTLITVVNLVMSIIVCRDDRVIYPAILCCVCVAWTLWLVTP